MKFPIKYYFSARGRQIDQAVFVQVNRGMGVSQHKNGRVGGEIIERGGQVRPHRKYFKISNALLID